MLSTAWSSCIVPPSLFLFCSSDRAFHSCLHAILSSSRSILQRKIFQRSCFGLCSTSWYSCLVVNSLLGVWLITEDASYHVFSRRQGSRVANVAVRCPNGGGNDNVGNIFDNYHVPSMHCWWTVDISRPMCFTPRSICYLVLIYCVFPSSDPTSRVRPSPSLDIVCIEGEN